MGDSDELLRQSTHGRYIYKTRTKSTENTHGQKAHTEHTRTADTYTTHGRKTHKTRTHGGHTTHFSAALETTVA